MADSDLNLIEVDHPLIEHLLTLMRNKSCPNGEYRHCMTQIMQFLSYEAIELLKIPVRTVTVETPLGHETTGALINTRRMVLVTMLRGGLPAAAAAHRLFPRASMAHIGFKRDRNLTEVGDPYIAEFPKPSQLENQVCLVFDTMIATGISAIAALKHLKEERGSLDDTVFICLVCSPKGARAVFKEYPEVKIVTASVDNEELDEITHVVPGIGRPSARMFETEEA